jgi:hypothetical protein
MDRYKKLEKIGSGTYGVVYKAKCKDTGVLLRSLQWEWYICNKALYHAGDFVALKKIRLEGDDEGVPSTAIREVSTLLELRHTNVVKLLDVICQDGKLLLVFEFLEQDLKKYIDTAPPSGFTPAHIKVRPASQRVLPPPCMASQPHPRPGPAELLLADASGRLFLPLTPPAAPRPQAPESPHRQVWLVMHMPACPARLA